VALRTYKDAWQARLNSRERLENYMAGIEASKSLADAESFQHARLLELLDADGLVSRVDGVVWSQGVTVAEESLLAVISTLRKLAVRGIASSNMLCALDRAPNRTQGKRAARCTSRSARGAAIISYSYAGSLWKR